MGLYAIIKDDKRIATMRATDPRELPARVLEKFGRDGAYEITLLVEGRGLPFHHACCFNEVRDVYDKNGRCVNCNDACV